MQFFFFFFLTLNLFSSHLYIQCYTMIFTFMFAKRIFTKSDIETLILIYECLSFIFLFTYRGENSFQFPEYWLLSMIILSCIIYFPSHSNNHLIKVHITFTKSILWFHRISYLSVLKMFIKYYVQQKSCDHPGCCLFRLLFLISQLLYFMIFIFPDHN